MIGFLFKKGFFDIWDNLLTVVLMNIGYAVCIALLALSGALADSSTLLSVLVLVLDVLFFSFYSLGISGISKSYSAYHKNGFKPFKEAIIYHWGHAVLLSVIVFAVSFMILYIIPFYLSMGGFLGMMLAMVMFWVLLFSLLSLQYYFGLCLHMEGDRALKTLKKCFIVMVDNPGVSLILFIRNLIGVAITVFTATLIPGLAGLNLFGMDTVRLLMFKYDFLEANPECTKKDIIWEDLLYEEKKLVGPRSLKGMIFPWKD